MAPTVTALPSSTLELAPEEREKKYVHAVYDQIASHFSQTRYKPWPIISTFLASITPGSIGLDSGTGNGKYLPLDQDGKVMMIGLDRSRKLLEIARNAGREDGSPERRREVICADVLEQPWRAGVFDFAISIATIHHLSTPQRRQQAVEALLQCLDPQRGRAMIYVWATEQDPLSKRVLPATLPDQATTTPQDTETPKTAQDVLVPWVKSTQQPKQKTPKPNSALQHPAESLAASEEDPPAPTVFQRYYHFFEKDELRNLVCAAAGNLGLRLGKGDDLGQSDEMRDGPVVVAAASSKRKSRGLEVVDEGYERSNYYVELRLWEQ